MPELSIILPTYNGGRFLPEQLESILAQSRADFELLVMDDGSTDGSATVVDEYARRDRRVRRLPSSGNLGQRRRLHQLIDAASTEFLAFADQDDVWHPERNARLLNAIGDRAVVFGRSQLMDAQGSDLGRSILEQFQLKLDAGPLASLFQPLVSAHAAIVRRPWIDIATLYGSIQFDRAIGLNAHYSTGLSYVDDAVVFHRIHEANQSNGSALASRVRRGLVSRYRARLSLSFVGAARHAFFSTLEHLARSAALPLETSRKFKRLTSACYNAWYYPHDRSTARGSWLERHLRDQLATYAASDTDLAVFTREVRSLTRSQYGFTNLREATKRYFAP